MKIIKHTLMRNLNCRPYLALKKLQTGTASRADMADCIFFVVLGNNSGGITSADDNGGTLIDSFDCRIQESLGAVGKSREFEDTWWSFETNSANYVWEFGSLEFTRSKGWCGLPGQFP